MNKFDIKIKNYYCELQKKLEDPRDNRGKKHDLSLVILLFMYSLIRSSGLLNYLKIHRQKKREIVYIQKKLGLKRQKCISYTQLKRILSIIDYKQFNDINNLFFEKIIKKEGRKWKSIDGKELRGTIDKIAGKKRSENLVQQVSYAEKENKVI